MKHYRVPLLAWMDHWPDVKVCKKHTKVWKNIFISCLSCPVFVSSLCTSCLFQSFLPCTLCSFPSFLCCVLHPSLCFVLSCFLLLLPCCCVVFIFLHSLNTLCDSVWLFCFLLFLPCFLAHLLSSLSYYCLCRYFCFQNSISLPTFLICSTKIISE